MRSVAQQLSAFIRVHRGSIFISWQSWRTPQGGIEKNLGGSNQLLRDVEQPFLLALQG
jgi:hypothetical protein